MKRHYQKELDGILRSLGGRRARVLLHSCCGPCSSAVLEYLTRYFDVTLLWFNPNLYPEAEFDKRLRTQRELLEKMGLADTVRILVEPWRSGEYYAATAGLEDEPEGGKRCTACFRLRLEETAKLARQRGFDYFCTTLSLSRYKDALRINALGEELGALYGVEWLPSDFKKEGREQRSVQLARQYGLYQQRYCGCEFSLRSREAHDAPEQ